MFTQLACMMIERRPNARPPCFWGTCVCLFGVAFSRQSHGPLTTTLLKSITIHLPFPSQHCCESMPSGWLDVVYAVSINLYHDTSPICIMMLLQKYQGQGSLEHYYGGVNNNQKQYSGDVAPTCLYRVAKRDPQGKHQA